MVKNIRKWKSENLGKHMEVSIYGHYGFSLIMFPAFTDECHEYEEEGLIDSIGHYITKGKCKVYCIEGINKESWFDGDKSDEQKSERHLQYNNYIIEELVPFIFGDCGGAVPILTFGCSLGAYHAANTYFRRPDILYGSIALSGTYNIEHLAKGYFDDNCYFNSPIHYLPNLTDEYWLSSLRNNHHLYILSGSGKGEFPENSNHMGEVLSQKKIPHMIDIWGPEFGHDYESWKKMLISIFETKL